MATTTIIPPNAIVAVTITGLADLQVADANETITINSNVEGHGNTKTVGTAAEETILDSSMLSDGASLDFDGVLITNKDDTNFVRIRLADTGLHTVDFRLEAGRFMIFWNRGINVSVTEGAFGAFTDIDTIVAQADTVAVDVRIVAFRF